MPAKSVAKRHSKSKQKSKPEIIQGAITPASVKRAMYSAGVVKSTEEAKLETVAIYMALLMEVARANHEMVKYKCQKTLALEHLKVVVNSFGRKIYV